MKGQQHLWTIDDSLAELAQLADTAGIEVVGQTYQRLRRANPATYVGQGKLKELIAHCDALNFDVLIFDAELLPRQQRELEEALGEWVNVLDRTALILDIFARHAHTREGALQVELAQYEYRLPRLTRQWTHLARQAGGGAARGGVGGVGLRGPGETQLETDRREISRRIAHLKDELERVRRHRRQYRQQRRQATIPVVSIVGYTNAGKSTLLNAISDANVLVEDKLFATLDPTTRRVTLPKGSGALFTDTVGFIQRLPTNLVAAFRATLEEINEANLLLHILDITHKNVLEQSQAVKSILVDLGASDKPIVTVLNKTDLLPDPRAVQEMIAEFPNSLAISAREGRGLEELLTHVETALNEKMIHITAHIPYGQEELVALFHRQGVIEWKEHSEQGTTLSGRLPQRFAKSFHHYLKTDERVRSEEEEYP